MYNQQCITLLAEQILKNMKILPHIILWTSNLFTYKQKDTT